MRTLLLLRGASGSGKSSFVNQNNLGDYTLSPDTIRAMYQSPISDITGTRYISQRNDRKMWDLLFQMLEERMQRGDFTIIDATHSRAGWVAQYKQLVEKYRYRTYVIEFMPSLEEILSRNKTRGVKYVPEDAIRRSYEFCKVDKLPKWIEPITSEQLVKLLALSPISYDKYSKIHHIGDIHGCLDPLQRYVNEVGGVKPDEMWIFVGDYLDRGIQNSEVLQYLFDNFLGKPNVYFLEGNHERHLRQWAFDEVVSSKDFTYHTAPQLKELDKKIVRTFTRKLGQLAYYTYNNQVVFVNHAGFPTIPSQLTPTFELIRGIGKYEDIYAIEKAWDSNTPYNYYQVHGHRNVELKPITNGRCFNLCDNIEFGGQLRVVTLDKNGWHEQYIPNTVYVEQSPTILAKLKPTSDDMVSLLLADKDIVKKLLGNNIVSFNFSSDVFKANRWSQRTMQARGLFININTGDIVARAWDKFFNVGENDETSWQQLSKHMSFPANVYIKENGFLGLIGYNPEDDSLCICSKTTNTGEFVEYFKSILLQQGIDLALVKSICQKGITLVFEVIDPVNDPHIIEYYKPELVLLAAIHNEFEYKEAALDEIGVLLGIKVKEFVTTLHSFDEFVTWYNEADNYNYEIEGYVIECADGYRLKVKTSFYKLWKKMRSVKDKLAKGQSYNTSHLKTQEEVRIYGQLKSLTRAKLQRENIIKIRNILAPKT